MGYVSFLDLYSGASKLPLRIFFCFRILQFFFPKQIPGLFVTIPRVVFCGGGEQKSFIGCLQSMHVDQKTHRNPAERAQPLP